MIGIVCSTADIASVNIAKALERLFEFSESSINGYPCKKYGKLCMICTDKELINTEFVDSFGLELIYFVSRHSSEKGISSFTTHPLGNWTFEAKLGGKPRQLSYAAPIEMLGVLNGFAKFNPSAEMSVSYEATHHGPLLHTPSLFVELGGNSAIIENEKLAEVPAYAIKHMLDNGAEYSKVVLGIGSNHYPSKFTKLALEQGYAFTHMLPKYAMLNADGTDNFSMLQQALERSSIAPEAAVIEWKSMNASLRNSAISALNEIGLDYERI